MRFWTSDWHLNSEIVLQTSHRPWKTVEEMNHSILKMTYDCNAKMTDQIIHVGDLIQSGKDRGTEIPKDHQMNWLDIVCRCAGMLILIEGNHDSSNAVPFVCRSMKTRVGNWNVTVGHYPTWNERAAGTFECGSAKHPTVHICGHVHEAFKVSYDKRHCVLNINVGLDAHNFKMLSDADLVELIDRGMRWYKHIDNCADHWFGDGYGFAEWEKDIAAQKQLEAIGKKAKMMEWLKVNKPEIYAAKTAKGGC